MSATELELPGPAWKLKEIMVSRQTAFVIFQSALDDLWVWRSAEDGTYLALLNSKGITNRLSQERWAEIYCKAIAGQALLGRKPEIVEQIF